VIESGIANLAAAVEALAVKVDALAVGTPTDPQTIIDTVVAELTD
jgi:hypothetical protein